MNDSRTFRNGMGHEIKLDCLCIRSSSTSVVEIEAKADILQYRVCCRCGRIPLVRRLAIIHFVTTSLNYSIDMVVNVD